MRFSPSAVVTIVTLVGVANVNAFQNTMLYSPTRRTAKQSHLSFSPMRSTMRMVSSSSVENVSAGSLDASIVPPDMEAYAAGYFTVFDEVPSTVHTVTSGQLPADLVGTYFRSGPAMFSAGSLPPPKTSIVQPKSPPVPDGQDAERMVKHPFEGDGAVLGLTLPGDGTVTSRFRYVRTNAFTNERKKGKKLYTGMENTRNDDPSDSMGQGNDFPLPMYKHHLLPGLNKKRKNTSNTRVIYWSKKLLTLWEGGLPYKLDSLALSTEGRSQLGGVLKEKDPFGGCAAYDSKKDRMLFYSNKQDAGSSDMTVYEFNSKFRLVSASGMDKVEVEMPGFALISDFGVTENYSVFVQPPVSTNGMQFMLNKEPGKSLKLEPKESLLHLIGRVGTANSGQMKSIPIPYDGTSDADLQFCNAYEEKDGTIVIDAIRSNGKNVAGASATKSNKNWPWATTLSDYASIASKKSLWRYTIRGTSVTKECLSNDQVVFGVVNPAVSGQKHKFVYATVGSMGDLVAPPQGIVKIDTESNTSEQWLPMEYEFCGEPMYSPRKKSEDDTSAEAEDDGYILSILFNGKTKESSLIVLEASNIQKGPIARVNLGVGIPHGYHGCFASTPEANWSAEEIERRAKLSDKMEGRGNMWNEVKSDFSGLGLRLDDIDEILGDIL